MSTIAVRNPGDQSIGYVSRESFDQHWKFLGWTEVGHDEVKVLSVVAHVIEEPVTTLDDLTKDQLLTAAERAGVDVKKNASKATIIDQLRQAAESGAATPLATTEPEEG